MAEKKNLTIEGIADMQCDEGKDQTIYWDSTTEGLGLRVTKAGTKAFIFNGRMGEQIRMTIGTPKLKDGSGVWTLSEARSKAREFKATIDKGIDPREVIKQAQTQAALDKATLNAKKVLVAEVWGEYIQYQQNRMDRADLSRGKKWGARHLLDHERMIQKPNQPTAKGGKTKRAGVLYPLMAKRLLDIDKDTLEAWVTNEAKTRANGARQGYEAFRAFWRWCSTNERYKGLINLSVVEGKDLRDNVPSRASKAGTGDALEANQLHAWFDAVRGLENPVISAYLQGLVLTGARREELASLKWEDVDFKWGAMWLHDKVSASRRRKIPLTPYLRHLIESMPRRNQWVFSSAGAKDGRLTEPRLAHNKALDIAGLHHVSIHGLRRTFISMSELEDIEIPSGVIAQVCGHKPSATAERHYKVRSLETLAAWMNKYEALILAKAGVVFVPLGGQRLKVV